MVIENKQFEISDNELEITKINDRLESLENETENELILKEFSILEQNIGIDLNLGIGKDGKYYIIDGKNNEKFLNLGLDKNELINIMQELPKLLDKQNSIILTGDKNGRQIEFGEKLIKIPVIDKEIINFESSQIKYDFSKGKNGNYKESDNYLYGNAGKNKNLIIAKNNEIEKIFIFIKNLRGEEINTSDLGDGICEGNVNQECINKLGK